MPYDGTIPKPNDQMSISQGDILNNFASILAAFDQNHVDFNAGLNIAGRHTFIQLAPQPPTPLFAGIPGFWANNASAGDIMIHTAGGADIDISAQAFAAGQGSTTLPSGIILKYGLVGAGGADGPFDLIFTNDFPGNCYSVTATIFDNAPAPNHFYIAVTTFNAHHFIVQRNSAVMATYGQLRNNAFTWFAIGI